jgi:hypothetical protein
MSTCQNCKGAGEIEGPFWAFHLDRSTKKCPSCKGTGQLPEKYEALKLCPECEGWGTKRPITLGPPCPTCDGRGLAHPQAAYQTTEELLDSAAGTIGETVVGAITQASDPTPIDWRSLKAYRIFPKTLLGGLSILLAIGFLAFFTSSSSLVDDSSNMWIVIFFGLAGASFVAGLISVIRFRERSLLVLLSVALVLVVSVGVWILAGV